MRSLERRVAAMEAARPTHSDRPLDLSALSDQELDQLEAILVRNQGAPIEEWPDDDLRFVASIRVPVDEEN